MKDLPEFTACVLEIDQNLVLWVDMSVYVPRQGKILYIVLNIAHSVVTVFIRYHNISSIEE